LWLLFQQELFILVAAGAAWRLFTKDAPPDSSPKTTAYYLTTLTLLALVRWLVLAPGSVVR